MESGCNDVAPIWTKICLLRVNRSVFLSFFHLKHLGNFHFKVCLLLRSCNLKVNGIEWKVFGKTESRCNDVAPIWTKICLLRVNLSVFLSFFHRKHPGNFHLKVCLLLRSCNPKVDGIECKVFGKMVSVWNDVAPIWTKICLLRVNLSVFLSFFHPKHPGNFHFKVCLSLRSCNLKVDGIECESVLTGEEKERIWWKRLI